MRGSFKGIVVGALVLAGVTMATAGAEAMPAPNLGASTVSESMPSLDKVWWRGGWGWRGYGWRGGWRGYGWRGGYGWPGFGYGWHRPYYGYGYGYGWRRPWGWRRW